MWPRLVGLGCIGVALTAALRSFDPMPTHVAVSSSARPVPKVETHLAVAPRLLRPIGAQAHTVDRFEWEAGAGAARHTLVLLSAGYEELARRALGDASGWSSDPELATLLACGGTFHWFVLAERAEGAVKSPIESFATP